MLAGTHEVYDRAGLTLDVLDTSLHGTTVATNAVLEGKGARVGLLVTRGWAHLLHLAESWTPGPLFGFFDYIKPEPLVEFEDVREITERIDSKGAMLEAVDEDAARQSIDELADAGIEALTICLLNSYANADHEQRVEALAKEQLDDIPVSIFSTITPEFREYARTVTTVMNSYVGGVLRRYLARLAEKLVQNGVTAPLQVVRSDGGLQSIGAAREHPVQTVLSGPSGGVNGAAYVAHRAGHDRILTFDMGGTSTDVAVCVGGVPTITRETRVGSFPVRAPSVEVESIGGGGPIASVSPVTGALQVGPHSAGTTPSPAAYGQGGTEPTVTDANVVLGHLSPQLLGGAMTLDVDAAQAAVQTVADSMGVDVHRAAEGIVAIVNETMLGALRVATVQKGLDPREFALVSFGGAGGLHANALAATLGCFPVIVPPEPGVLSALGFVAADVRNEFGQTAIQTTDRAERAEVAALLSELGRQGDAWLTEESIDRANREIAYVLDMRYHRQGYKLPVDVSVEQLASLDLREVADRFRALHESLYGFSLPGAVEIVNVRAQAVGRVHKPTLADHEAGDASPSAAQVGTQEIWDGGVRRSVPLFDRAQLQHGMRIEGFGIVTQYDATTVVLPAHAATVDRWLNLVIEPTGTS
ncbi:MAG: hydantoinase/oxoprolinase family protein [Actinomycetia bacterium]|nr:hydantoinase/oxoprolinase family protein [Actinomycetes bacterium]